MYRISEQRIIPVIVADEKPLALWERGGPRRALVIAFSVALALTVLILFPDLSAFCERLSWFKNLLAAITVGLGLLIAFLEFLHSGEANKHRDQLNRLTEKANEQRQEANRLNAETLKLQTRIQVLQEDIERKLTKVRLYARVQKSENGMGVQLLVSNLSDFDLWITQVRLVVTESTTAVFPKTLLIGGGNRISRGYMETGYRLYGKILEANDNRNNRIEMKFYVQVEAQGVSDQPVPPIDSPVYSLRVLDGLVINLDVLSWSPESSGGSAPQTGSALPR